MTLASRYTRRLATLGLAALCAAPAVAQTSASVSIGIYQPGVYGRIDIGNQPPPRVIYAQPVVYAPPPVLVHPAPVYLYVPPGHRKHWGKYCGRYEACGRPVYFVQESWVRERYEEQHGPGKGHGKGKGHGNH